MGHTTIRHPVSGTAMGIKLAPSNANLFKTKFDEKHVYTYVYNTKHGIFIDGIFLIWHNGMESLQQFVNHLTQ